MQNDPIDDQMKRVDDLAQRESVPASRITDTISIGNVLALNDPRLIREAGAKAVLCLNGQLEGKTAEDLGLEEVRNFNIIDGEGNDPELLKRIVHLALKMEREHGSVMVACQAGRSRSATVVAGCLMIRDGLSVDEAIDFVASKRSINIQSGLVDLLDYLYPEDLSDLEQPDVDFGEEEDDEDFFFL